MKTNQSTITIAKTLLVYLLFIVPNIRGNTQYPFCADYEGPFNVTVGTIKTIKDCKWVALKPARCIYKEVPSKCFLTCNNCECFNNPEPFTVESTNFDSGSEIKTCNWVKENPTQRCVM